MAEKNGIYKCLACGNVVEVIHKGMGELVCCGKPMEQQIAKSEDAGLEKHVPVMEIDGNHVTVKVGDIAHPMEEEHFISLIEVLSGDDVVAVSRLNPGDEPKAEFDLSDTDGLSARALCNIHGLWKSK